MLLGITPLFIGGQEVSLSKVHSVASVAQRDKQAGGGYCKRLPETR